VTLLFFFTEKKKRSKKRKELAFHLYYTAMHHTKITQETVPHRFSSTKLPRRGEQAAAAAVTLPFSLLKLGRRVSGDSPQKTEMPQNCSISAEKYAMIQCSVYAAADSRSFWNAV
ncbi:hypothetical protein, partial [Ruminococcus callidus]|uniref:hypothetical protein n=1 Tax=Ruminococcus callidus TaxID=40519 RepID=UPI0039A2994B